MSDDRHEYTLELHSGPVTVLLTDEDAARRGLSRAPKKAVKAEPEPEAEVEEKAAKPANKSRTAANKHRAAAVEAAFTKK